MWQHLKLANRVMFHARITEIAVFALLIMVVAMALAAQFSARQVGTVALDVGLSVLRISIPLIIVFATTILIAKDIDRRIFLTSLTYPHSRVSWLLGRTFAVMLIVLAFTASGASVVGLLASYLGSSYAQQTPIALGAPYLLTIGFLFLDAVVVLAVTVFLSVVASTPAFVVIGSIGFVLVARSYMPILRLLNDDRSLVKDLASPESYQASLNLLSFLVPDLGSLDIRMISLYGKWEMLPQHWGTLVFSALAYALAFLAATLWRLSRRDFS